MIQFFKRNPFWAVAAVALLSAVIYWGVMATDRYVSRAHIVLQTPEIVPTGLNVSSLLSGTSGSGDLLLLKDHLESVRMLKTLQKRLDIRSHYSQPDIDVFSRLSDKKVPIEKFHSYMQQRINILFDDYSSVLKIEVQAYTPEMAQKIVEALLEEGERHMNQMGQRLAAEQVEFIAKQAQELEARLFAAREAMLAYQNEHGLVAPTQTVEAIFETVSRLEAELAVQKARTAAQSSFQSASSPEIRRLKAETQSLEEQIEIEKEKMARQGGDALNEISAEYETLQMRAQFALELYSSALTTLETTRVEASRKLKQVSVLEFPTLPEYSVKPDRLYNVIVFAIFSILFASILQMVMAVIRDHRD